MKFNQYQKEERKREREREIERERERERERKKRIRLSHGFGRFGAALPRRGGRYPFRYCMQCTCNQAFFSSSFSTIDN